MPFMAKKKTTKRTTKKVCYTMTYEILCDYGTDVCSLIPFVQQVLGIIITSPPNGGAVKNPVKATGDVINDGRSTVTAWLTDPWGNKTYGTVTGPDVNGYWSATFPNVITNEYLLTAKAQLDTQSASQTIQITIEQ
jgi:hypothetical protein